MGTARLPSACPTTTSPHCISVLAVAFRSAFVQNERWPVLASTGELDFIVNYDIEYRAGRSDADANGE